MDKQGIIIYNTDDGKTSVRLLAKDGNVWLNQQLMSEPFDTSIQNISLHIINIIKDNMALTSWKGKIVRKQDIYNVKSTK
jgi:hypothetical protein